MLKPIGFLLFALFSFSGYAQSVYSNDNLERSNPYFDAITWISPENFVSGQQYELVELGIDLPESIQSKIDLFLATDDSIHGINPFLEWQLDISATFTGGHRTEVIEKDAFYYNDYSRDTSHHDFRQWKWNREETSHYMRVRFAPPRTGKWNCEIKVKTKDTSFTYPSFQFNVTASDNPGYVKIGKSRRFFTLGDQTFFPAGQNLVSPRCEYCFTNTAKTLPSEKTGPAAQSLESWMLEPTVVKGYIMFQDHMRSLAAQGGNFFRELLMPQNQDIEWEKLGNYYGRQNCAWEIDQQLFLAHELNLKIQLNLQIQFALEADQNRIFWNWSVDPNDKRHITPQTPCANPYNRQIATTKNDDPNTFFSDPTAKKFYKQKLRYIIARWGYSTNIAIFGMASEIETACTDSPVCVSWMNEMGDYLKNELKINQLLTPSFLGIYHDPENYEYEILRQKHYDMSTLNWYSVSPAKFQGSIRILNEFIEKFDKPFFFGEMGNSDLYTCDTSRIEWVRDAWMSAFTGNAGVGLNWDDPFDDELRVHLGNISRFVAGINFDGNGNPWKPQRIVSDNRKVETLFLISPEKDFAVGVISNRYYNWYMDKDSTLLASNCVKYAPVDPGFDHTLPPKDRGIWEQNSEASPTNYIDNFGRNSEQNAKRIYYPFQSFDYTTDKHNRLRIYNLKNGVYTLDFYNALTMEYLGSQTNRGPNVKLEYPEMNQETGLIAFKIRRNKSGDFPQQ